MSLPNQNMEFTSLTPLPASDLNKIVENVESLEAGTGFTDNININTISEKTGAAGVTIDGCPIKDKLVVGGAAQGVANSSLDTTAGDLGGVWKDWTPTLTNLAGGTLNYAKYTQIGKTVHFRLQYTLGGAGVSGNVVITLPVTSIDYLTGNYDIGLANCADTGTGNFAGVIKWVSTTTARPLVIQSGGTYASYGALSSTVPFTWASTDILTISGTYEAA